MQHCLFFDENVVNSAMEKKAKINQKRAGELLLTVLRDIVFEENKNNVFQKLDSKSRNAVIECAVKNQLGALFYYYCRQLDIELPDDCNSNRDIFLAATSLSMRREAQLKKIFTAFAKENITATLLKGSYTAEACYPHPGLRTMSDLDILLLPDDIYRARELLVAMGYEHFRGSVDNAKHLSTLCHPRELLAVELHHAIAKEYITAEKIWKYTLPAENLNESCRFFCPEMLLLHNCLHTVEEHFAVKLRDILETALIIEKLKPDAEKLYSTALDFNSLPELSILLTAVEHFFGVSMDFGTNKLTTVNPDIIDDLISVMSSKHSFKTQKSVLLTRETADMKHIQKLHFLGKRAFLPRQQIASMYNCSSNSPKLPLYYLHRFIKNFTFIPETWSPKSKDREKLKARNVGLCQKRLKNFISKQNAG